MGLSNEVIARFVKAANSKETVKPDSAVYGTVVEYDGRKFVRLDGSDRLTPVTSTAAANADERVSVSIKNHTAVITGNVSSPAARTEDVDNIGNQIAEFDIIIADKINTQEFYAQVGRIDELVTYDLTVKNELIAANADIENLKAKNVEIDGLLVARKAEIDELAATKIDAELVRATYAEIGDLEATNAQIHNLNATYANFYDATVKNLDVINGTIDNLSAEYANIDFANIGEAAIKKLFSETGLIKDLVVGDSTITGELVGVTIKGDLIEAGTLKADRLVVKGSDGNYYKLNLDGMEESVEVVEEDQINGKTIVAKSITAEKVSVKDLIAFGATIASFIIDNAAIRSAVKDSPVNTTRGLYLGNDGQFAVGDDTNFVRFYEFEDGLFRLELNGAIIKLGGREKTLVEELDDIAGDNNELNSKVIQAESTVNSLIGQISNLVSDANGESLMTQTSTGWTFRTTEIQGALNDAVSKLGELNEKLGGTDATVDVLQKAVSDLQGNSEYVRIQSYENEPCIELGKVENNIKVLITNTRIMFRDAAGAVSTYIDRTGVTTDNVNVKSSINHGNFSWVLRPNGHLSLIWSETPPVVYNVHNEFTNVTSSNTNSVAENGESYSTVLTADPGYSISSVVVTMNEVDVTGVAYDPDTNTVTVDYVTGKIVIVAVAEVSVYSITKNFVDVLSDSDITGLQHGTAYSDTLYVSSEYIISSVQVLMGGEDVTSTVYEANSTDQGVITITGVTGDIVINASAIAKSSICTVVNTLTNVTTTNSADRVLVGETYQATLSTGHYGYVVGDVTVKMAGINITNDVYNPETGVVYIDFVTGAIEISAVANQREFSITLNLVNVNSSNIEETAKYGNAYSATLTAYDRHAISSVSVIMNNKDVTSSVYNATTGVITIPAATGGVTGDIVITASAVLKTYIVTNNLTNVSSNNASTSVIHGDSYFATLTADPEHVMENVHVYMGDEDITNDVYNLDTRSINISSVDNAIVIVATAVPIYSITYNLSSFTSSNTATSITGNSSYKTTLTSGYASNADGITIVIVMGGVDVTSQYVTPYEINSVYSGMSWEVDIPAVTGELEIHARYAYTRTINFTVTNATWTYNTLTRTSSTGPTGKTIPVVIGSPFYAYVNGNTSNGPAVTIIARNTSSYVTSDITSTCWNPSLNSICIPAIENNVTYTITIS